MLMEIPYLGFLFRCYSGPTFNGLREAAKRLRPGGRIINFSTSVVGTKLETYGIYAATKSAIETLTAILSKELRGKSITVNAIAPGPTATDLFLRGKSQELVDRFAKMNPLERLGTPQDIAAVISPRKGSIQITPLLAAWF
jgi:3-oxoacyl-[acyl-carrier protein] reductase